MLATKTEESVIVQYERVGKQVRSHRTLLEEEEEASKEKKQLYEHINNYS